MCCLGDDVIVSLATNQVEPLRCFAQPSVERDWAYRYNGLCSCKAAIAFLTRREEVRVG